MLLSKCPDRLELIFKEEWKGNFHESIIMKTNHKMESELCALCIQIFHVEQSMYYKKW